MFEVKSNDDGTYSICKEGNVMVGAKLNSVKQNYIGIQRNKRTVYQLTDREAVISVPDGKGGFHSVSGVPVR